MDTNVTKNSCKTNNNPINSNESNATEILQNLLVENASRLIIGHFHILHCHLKQHGHSYNLINKN